MLSIEQIIITALTVICIILLISMILKKDHKKESNGDAGNWSEKQKAVIYDKVLYAVMLKGFDLKGYVASMCDSNILDMMHCIVHKISDKYSYKYANLNFILILQDNTFMNKIKDDCAAICLGTKGQWADTVKSAVFSRFMQTNLPEPQNLGDNCIQCIVDQLENNYDPLDPKIIDFIKHGRGLDYSKEMNLCKYVKKCV